ncbi:hypothetical protein I316_04503 [Kwoniella heveanensis BCC8398]|uniref:Glycosyltransferase 61 catalytic domain-containing protein n=1 Tax=Kwoniella heveanensis BCC8398 TaxID=1296120 RepID=A0A1B9GRX2_9TREE|nr:hypothetical protein I316_04503 [Kwoniella heveanensis BCC8398]
MPSLTPRVLIRTGAVSLALLILLYLTTSSSTNRSSASSWDKTSTYGREGVFGDEFEPDPASGASAGAGWFGGGRWSDGVRDWVQSGWRGDYSASSLTSSAVGNDGGGGLADGWIDMGDGGKGMPFTRYEGGIPGYQVFSNLYLNGATLTAIRPSSLHHSHPHAGISQDGASSGSDGGIEGSEGELQHDLTYQDRVHDQSDGTASSTGVELEWPDVKAVVSSEKRGTPAGEDRWRVVEEAVGREEMGKRVYKLGGVTYIFNDPPGPDGYLVFFRHFVLEAFLGATRMLASTLPSSSYTPVPRRVWFPRCGADPSWRDDRGENAWFLAHALPSASVEDKLRWDDRTIAGLPVLLEKVVIIDRWTAHSAGGEVGKWGKMNAMIPSIHAPKAFWNPFRKNMMSALGVDGHSENGSRGLPVVVYIDRQKENPKMRVADHEKLVESLKGLTDIAEVHVARISAMSKARQVDLMGRAQVVISLHGDDLFHTLWMPPKEGSTVIELFEKGGFVRDFELLASALNHRHIAVQGDHELTEEQWRASGVSRGDERGTGEISIDSDLVLKLVKKALSGLETDEALEIRGEGEAKSVEEVCAVGKGMDC